MALRTHRRPRVVTHGVYLATKPATDRPRLLASPPAARNAGATYHLHLFFLVQAWHLVCTERRLPRRALRCRLRDPPLAICYSKDLVSFAFDPQKNADRYFCYRHRSTRKNLTREKKSGAQACRREVDEAEWTMDIRRPKCSARQVAPE